MLNNPYFWMPSLQLKKIALDYSDRCQMTGFHFCIHEMDNPLQKLKSYNDRKCVSVDISNIFSEYTFWHFLSKQLFKLQKKWKHNSRSRIRRRLILIFHDVDWWNEMVLWRITPLRRTVWKFFPSAVFLFAEYRFAKKIYRKASLRERKNVESFPGWLC